MFIFTLASSRYLSRLCVEGHEKACTEAWLKDSFRAAACRNKLWSRPISSLRDKQFEREVFERDNG